jgi:8-oxo-dGTP pyrophosphatase MutT (NUDIX family)
MVCILASLPDMKAFFANITPQGHTPEAVSLKLSKYMTINPYAERQYSGPVQCGDAANDFAVVPAVLVLRYIHAVGDDPKTKAQQALLGEAERYICQQRQEPGFKLPANTRISGKIGSRLREHRKIEEFSKGQSGEAENTGVLLMLQIFAGIVDNKLVQTGQLDMPGGKRHLGETPEAAGARELWEETGLKMRDFLEAYAPIQNHEYGGSRWFYLTTPTLTSAGKGNRAQPNRRAAI